jgi:hypothetical protein
MVGAMGALDSAYTPPRTERQDARNRFAETTALLPSRCLRQPESLPHPVLFLEELAIGLAEVSRS